MATKKPISWFLTQRGRNFSFAVVTGTSLALTTLKFAPHTFCINQYKNFVHQYNNGAPVPLPPELTTRFEKCLEILKIHDVQKKLITPFSAFGYDLFHAGSKLSRFGAIIGIPVHFTYKTVDDVTKENIQVNQKPIDWSSETGMKLAESLVLPEKVQEFAICREILSTQNSKAYIESTYPFLCILTAFTIAQTINKKLNLYKAPTAARVILYNLTGLFAIGCYFLFQDFTEVYYEMEIDKTLCEVNPEFVECGVKFYDKLLKRNQALRELMGNEGAKKYSKLGNENFGIRQPRIPIMHRKQFFESALEGDGSLNKAT